MSTLNLFYYQVWYRYFSDSWVEQGNYILGSAGVAVTANLLCSYRDTNWIINTTSRDINDAYPISCDAQVVSNSAFQYTHGFDGSTYAEWFYYIAFGYYRFST